MAKYEYLEVRLGSTPREDGKPIIQQPKQLQNKTLDVLGREGWEAIGFDISGWLLLKRNYELWD